LVFTEHTLRELYLAVMWWSRPQRTHCLNSDYPAYVRASGRHTSRTDHLVYYDELHLRKILN
jgi:hypothetical protein